MERKTKPLILILIFVLCLGLLIFALVHGHAFAVLSPRGTIAEQEKHLLILFVSLMLIVVIPMFGFLFYIVTKYRADKNQLPADYSPNWEQNPWVTLVIWAIPVTLIATLAVFIWQSTHRLDPYKAIAATTPPLTIQVVALNWKWLFIYPQQNIATINYIEIPVGTPINFELTADAPMSTFWIPQLGSQVYAMPAMENQVHLIATAPGTYNGASTEIDGAGFAGMRFKANAISEQDYQSWLSNAKSSTNILNQATYDQLVKDSTYNPEATYSSVEPNLFYNIIMKYMMPAQTQTATTTMPSMDMSGM